MKRRVGTWLLLALLCLGLQAKKRVVKAPYFTACNTTSIEIGKVVLGADTTWLEVNIYGAPGDKVRIDSATVLRAEEKEYGYLGNEGISGEPWTQLPESGELTATLKFAPLPLETSCFDFLEAESEGGWCIYDVRLDGQKPRAEIPARLLERRELSALPLPAPELNCGKAVVKGQLLGYRPEYGLTLKAKSAHWFFHDPMGQAIPIQPDGTFRYEAEVLMPCGGTLQIGRKRLDLFLVPGGELEITVDLPAMYREASRLFGQKQKGEAEPCIWFEGDYAALNTELQDVVRLKDFFADREDFGPLCGMTPMEYKKHLLKLYSQACKQLEQQRELGTACREYTKVNIDMELFSKLFSYKFYLSYAPMLSGRQGVKRADMEVDSTTYFNEALELETLRSPLSRFYPYYVDFVKRATSDWLRDRFEQEPLWNDILLGKRAAASLSKQMPLTPAERLTVDSISEPQLRQIFLDRSRKIEERLAAAQAKTGYSIVTADPELGADSLLQVLTRPYRGRVVLVDMWNTWCGPCMRAMKEIQPLKEEMKEVVYLYIANETSPEGQWKLTIPDIHGIHCRITNEQSNALSQLYGYSGIPTYFVFDRHGEISYKVTGFPGTETLKEELEKVLKETAEETGKVKANFLIGELFFAEYPTSAEGVTVQMAFLKDEQGEKVAFIEGVELTEEDRRYAIPRERVEYADFWLAQSQRTDLKKLPIKLEAPKKTRLWEGDRLEAFSVTDTEGHRWSNETTLGKPLLINFWYTGCGPCIREMPELSGWTDAYPEVNFLAVTWNTQEEIQKIVDRQGFRFHQVAGDKTLWEMFAVKQTPTTVLIDKEGIVRKVVIGTNQQKRDAMAAALKELAGREHEQ